MKAKATLLIFCLLTLLSGAGAVKRLQEGSEGGGQRGPIYPEAVEATWESVVRHTFQLMDVLPPYMRYRNYYKPVQLMYAWYDGYAMEDKWKNSTACIDAWTNWTYVEKPAYKGLKQQANDSFEKWSLKGDYAANLSYHYWTCSSMFYTFSEYWNERFQPYRETPQFSPTGVFFLSMANNLPGQLFSITNIYNSIINNLNSDPIDSFGIHYDIARLVKVLTIFDMIEFEDGLVQLQTVQQVSSPPDPDSAVGWSFWDWLEDQAIIPMSEERVARIENVWVQSMKVYDVSRGFANGTNFIFGGNRTECQFSFQVGLTSTGNSFSIFANNKTYFGALNSFNSMAELPIQFNRSVSSCYYSVREIKIVSRLYASTFTSFNHFGFNLFFNTGQVAKGVNNVYYYFKNQELTRVKDFFTLGTEFGQMFYYLVFPYEVRLNEQLKDPWARFDDQYGWFNMAT